MSLHSQTMRMCMLRCAGIATFLVIVGCLQSARAQSATTEPAVDTATIDTALGAAGKSADEVYAVEVPRTDLHLTIEGMDVPTAASVASHFYFDICPCGKRT
jgi:hypothetical protein